MIVSVAADLQIQHSREFTQDDVEKNDVSNSFVGVDETDASEHAGLRLQEVYSNSKKYSTHTIHPGLRFHSCQPRTRV